MAIKALGQNFLTSHKVVSHLVDIVASITERTIVEIGPGRGSLTIPLSTVADRLICIEKDPILAEYIKSLTHEQSIENVTVVNDDILSVPLSAFPSEPFQIVGSLPFNISKPIIKRFLTFPSPPLTHMTVIVQKEVALSYTNPPPHADFLYHLATIYSSVRYHMTIPRTGFLPVPKVNAALISFSRAQPPPDHQKLTSFIRACFSQPRKTLENNMKPLLKASKRDRGEFSVLTASEGIDLQRRPANLSTDEFIRLFKMYNAGESK